MLMTPGLSLFYEVWSAKKMSFSTMLHKHDLSWSRQFGVGIGWLQSLVWMIAFHGSLATLPLFLMMRGVGEATHPALSQQFL
jgi:hypothetical protein